jgi:hypothetical protein
MARWSRRRRTTIRYSSTSTCDTERLAAGIGGRGLPTTGAPALAARQALRSLSVLGRAARVALCGLTARGSLG